MGGKNAIVLPPLHVFLTMNIWCSCRRRPTKSRILETLEAHPALSPLAKANCTASVGGRRRKKRVALPAEKGDLPQTRGLKQQIMGCYGDMIWLWPGKEVCIPQI